METFVVGYQMQRNATHKKYSLNNCATRKESIKMSSSGELTIERNGKP